MTIAYRAPVCDHRTISGTVPTCRSGSAGEPALSPGPCRHAPFSASRHRTMVEPNAEGAAAGHKVPQAQGAVRACRQGQLARRVDAQAQHRFPAGAPRQVPPAVRRVQNGARASARRGARCRPHLWPCSTLRHSQSLVRKMARVPSSLAVTRCVLSKNCSAVMEPRAPRAPERTAGQPSSVSDQPRRVEAFRPRPPHLGAAAACPAPRVSGRRTA